MRVNIKGFGKDLKARGFAVIPCQYPDSIHKNIVLHVVASFPSEDPPNESPFDDSDTESLHVPDESDTFLMAIEGHNQLPRALRTIFWSSKRVPYLSFRPQLASQPELEERLLQPFHQLRRVSKVIIKGTHRKNTAKNIGKVMQKGGHTAKDILEDLKDALGTYLRPEVYTDDCVQVMNLEWTLALLCDHFCENWGSFSFEDNKHHSEMRVTTFRLAEEIARAKFQLRQYAVVVTYTRYALGMMRSGIPDSEKITLLLMQAEAFDHLGMENEVSASLLGAGLIAPSNRDIQQKLSEREERLDSDPAKSSIAYDHYTQVENQICRRDKILQFDPRDYE